MAMPKHKISKARRDMRKANHLKVKDSNPSKCPQCGELKLSHRVCIHCGFYKGKEIVKMNGGD
ncbi:MAG: 50S ribosomal protein L32 [Deltaproteobacteria bacterium RIFCSPLOWO2_02_FULL_47_10]|nr:MAG: 50S ribosomal protein L32 [Deltaproteobacteria bacterium RIFCSPLOWO2_02_FULL_47_10]